MKTKMDATILLFFALSLSLYGQNDYWSVSTFRNGTQNVSLKQLNKNNYKVFQLHIENFKQALKGVPLQRQLNGRSTTLIKFPDVNGKFKDYRIVETSIFSDPDYAAIEHPNIKTYLGFSIDGSGERVRFSVTPLGLKSMTSILGEKTVFIQPVTKMSNGQYLIYNRDAKLDSEEKFKCLMDDLIEKRAVKVEGELRSRDANDQLLRTFRLAASVTSEYTAHWDDGDATNGDARADAFAQMVSTLNRNNEVYEVDMAITFVLVDTADDPALDLVYSGTDPYSDASILADLQANLSATVGEEDYDIGHVLHLSTFPEGEGAAACIGCVCEDGQKGGAYSAHPFTGDNGGPYMADYFDIDFVPHEIGHQMGGYHTFSMGNEGMGVNSEPGSGTTIMAYAGITGVNDVQDHSDALFHYHTIDQILNNVDNKCASTTPIANAPPVANAGADYNIPPGTAFILKGMTEDSDTGDVHTYTWEQIDDGLVTSAVFGPTNTQGASWRSRPPSVSPNRYMPIFDRVLEGKLTEINPTITADNSSWETVSTVARELNFALTVRDRAEADGLGQMPQSSFDLMKVTVEDVTPFTVLTPGAMAPGVSNEIFWTVGETDNATINCQTVR